MTSPNADRQGLLHRRIVQNLCPPTVWSWLFTKDDLTWQCSNFFGNIAYVVPRDPSSAALSAYLSTKPDSISGPTLLFDGPLGFNSSEEAFNTPRPASTITQLCIPQSTQPQQSAPWRQAGHLPAPGLSDLTHSGGNQRFLCQSLRFLYGDATGPRSWAHEHWKAGSNTALFTKRVWH